MFDKEKYQEKVKRLKEAKKIIPKNSYYVLNFKGNKKMVINKKGVYHLKDLYGVKTELVEWKVFNNIDKGIDVIAVLDIKGALNIEKIYPSAISIFIMPPTFEELERRIRERGTDSEDVIRQRLKIAKEEIKNSNKYDYVVINNTVDKAVEEIIQIINKEKNK